MGPDAKHTYDNQHIPRNLTKGLKKEPVRPVVFPPPPPNPNEIEDENNQRKKIAPAGIPETEKNQSSDKKKRPETPVQRRDRKMKALQSILHSASTKKLTFTTGNCLKGVQYMLNHKTCIKV